MAPMRCNVSDRCLLRYGWLGAACLMGTSMLGGCGRHERVLDVEAPGVDIEVNRSDDGEVDVHVDDKPD